MQLKICKSTKTVRGCGIEKDINQFPKTKHAHQAVCKQCIAEHRRTKDKIIKIDPEAALFNMANIAWR